MINRFISFAISASLLLAWYVYDFINTYAWQKPDWSHFSIPTELWYPPLFIQPIRIIYIPYWFTFLLLWWIIDWTVSSYRHGKDWSFGTRNTVFVMLLVLAINEILMKKPGWF